MTTRLITLNVATVLVTAAMSGMPALAQSTPPAATAAAAAPAQTTQGKQVEARAEKWISDLHSRLHITASEQPQWDALAQVMRANALHMEQVYAGQRGDPAKASALDDMRAYATITEAHAEDIQKLLPAFEALYTAMTPEQKQTADTVFRQYARQTQARRIATH